MNLLEGRVALITGAASGLGAVTAKLFAEEGASVVVADVQDDAGESTACELRAAGHEARYVRANVRDDSQMDAAVATAEAAFGKLDIVVANAGILGNATFRRTEEMLSSDWLDVIDVNLNGVFRTFRAAIPALRRNGGGSMSATSSISGMFASCYLAAYSASKGGVNALVRSLSIELTPDRIRVNAVCPGPMETNISDSLGRSRDSLDVDRPDFSSKSRAITEGRDGTGDIAKVHLFLCSDMAAYINGECLVADGGFSIWNGV
jgi:NAD(P)-dependent dehydrogenase (short-subunit alcohol dehydrogenase family)